MYSSLAFRDIDGEYMNIVMTYIFSSAAFCKWLYRCLMKGMLNFTVILFLRWCDWGITRTRYLGTGFECRGHQHLLPLTLSLFVKLLFSATVASCLWKVMMTFLPMSWWKIFTGNRSSKQMLDISLAPVKDTYDNLSLATLWHLSFYPLHFLSWGEVPRFCSPAVLFHFI